MRWLGHVIHNKQHTGRFWDSTTNWTDTVKRDLEKSELPWEKAEAAALGRQD